MIKNYNTFGVEICCMAVNKNKVIKRSEEMKYLQSICSGRSESEMQVHYVVVMIAFYRRFM